MQPGDASAMTRRLRPRDRGDARGAACSSPARGSSRSPPRRPCACPNGERIVTDGPFAETKEQLGGFYVLDCKDLDEAIDWAAKIPGAQSGCVEVRPVIQYDVVAPDAAIDRLFRRESGRAVATLIRVLGDFDLAEEAVQEAWVVALERWPRDGVPRNPGAWITTTARNRAIDRLRRARVLRGEARSRSRRWPTRAARRGARRPPAADVHLLPPGARRRGARGADAAHARRPVGAGGRARVPRRRAGDGQAARARQAQDRRRRDRLPRARGARSCRTGCRRCSPPST